MKPSSYIGIPYEEKDCWDLVRHIFNSELRLDIGDREKQSTGIKDGRWVEVARGNERPFDVVLIETTPLEKHVGLVTGKNRFLHTMKGVGSCEDYYNSIQWTHRVKKFYRRKALQYQVL